MKRWHLLALLVAWALSLAYCDPPTDCDGQPCEYPQSQ